MTTRKIPSRIARIEELAYNLWWSWNDEARDLWESLDPCLWDSTEHNPVKMLHEVPDDRLKKIAADPAFLKRHAAVFHDFDEALEAADSWCGREHPEMAK